MKEENEKNKVKLNELQSIIDTEAKLKDTAYLESKSKKKVAISSYVCYVYLCTCNIAS